MEKKLREKLPTGTFLDVSKHTRKSMTAIKSKNNKSTEIRFKMLLVRNHLKGWSTNYREIVGKPDFFFKQENVAIFIDGCFWHGCPQCGHIPKTRSDFWKAKITRNKERDMKVTLENEQNGVKVLRFWEHELKNKVNRAMIIHQVKIILNDRVKNG